tara:strand:- start:758 stop:1183 length:426 start_codon:yes stop_codon:yes gene_type:complete
LAEKTNVLKEEFISNVTHELCIPLTSIRKSLGFVNIGVMGEVPKAFKEPLETVDPNATVLLNLRNELLDLQKLNSRHTKYDFKPVVIGDLIKEICVNTWGIANELKIQSYFFGPENDNHGELGRIRFFKCSFFCDQVFSDG